MGLTVPKQFLLLHDRPILMHTIAAFVQYNPAISVVLVLPADEQEQWQQLCEQHHFDIPCKIANGGATRSESVQNGLALVPADCVVGIHDGVRPLVSEVAIQRCYQTASEKGNAIPIMPVVESMRQTEGTASKAVNRNNFCLVQTPQCFRSELIQAAYAQSNSESFTDDATVLENSGTAIHLVEGNRENIKITTAADLLIAEALL